MRVAVVGVGLIGGSVALAARERAGATVLAWDADPSALQAALHRGAADRAAGSLADAVADAEVAFVAVPVGALSATVAEVLAAAPAGCVVTDVGSTKRAVRSAHVDQRFVGGHPLAGAETAGIEHARSDLFAGASWYLTPTENTSGLLYERLHRLLSSFGARPAAIDADTHDTLLALVSHLPHVLANVLVTQAAGNLGGERLPAVGPSFRDATRVAGAPSRIWTDIYLSNRDALAAQLDATVQRLEEIRAALSRGDREWITAWNDAAGEDRRRLLEAQLAGGELDELRVSVPNRPGVIARLALELGRAGVNIADLALYPAPDMSEGVVALWIAGDEPARRAQEIIEGLGHAVYRP
jgi:prephenate dehydrogenase